jgi:hypothetical protein
MKDRMDPVHAGFSFNLLTGELEALYGEKS